MWLLAIAAALAGPLDDARRLQEAGRTEEAVAAFQRIVAAEPDHGEAWLLLGSALLDAARHAEALEALARAEALDTRVAVARYLAAGALAQADRPDEALVALQAALDLGLGAVGRLREDPALDPLRTLPAFARITAELETVDVLRIATGRDGVRAGLGDLRARLQASCAVGEATACALDGVDLRDRAEVRKAVEPLCAEGAGIPAACLSAAWTVLDPSPTGAFRVPPDSWRRKFVAWVQAACDGGLARACTELGYAWDLGLVRYPNGRKARALWTSACERQEHRGCTAAELSGSPADAEGTDADVTGVLLRDGEADAAALERACLAGSSLACARYAAQVSALPETALVSTREACDEDDTAACALLARLGLVAGRVEIDEALARLDAACPSFPEACEEASFLRQGAPPVAGYPDPPPDPKDVKRGLFDLGPALHQCLLAAVQRDPGAQGWVDAVLRLDLDGRVVGVHMPAPLDDLHRVCLVDVLRTTRIRPGGPNPARVTVTLPAFHGVVVKVAPLTSAGDGVREAAQVSRDAAAWSEPLDRCAAEGGAVSADFEILVELVAHRDGRLTDVELVDGIDEPEVERCIVDWLAARRMAERPAMQTRLQVQIRLFQPRQEADQPDDAPDFALDIGDAAGPPVVVKMLVLSAERARVGRARGRLTAGSIRSIEAAHREMADAVERMTHGRIRIEVTARTLHGRIDIEAANEADGLARYQILPDDLPLWAWTLLQPGEFDSIMLWGPIPLGYPRPALGVTYGGVTLAGATLSSGAIPSRQELRANTGVPAWELPLHEWWHQVEGRARNWLQLETAWPPQNHDPLKVGARRLDPRTWLDETNDTAIAWYEHVLGSMPRAFWADVWARGERIARDDANLALQAIPMGEGIVFADGLADTVLSFGRYRVPATEEGASLPWFGLLWSQERTVGRIVIHIGGRNGRSWSDAVLGYRTHEDDEWVPIRAEVTRDGDRWTFTFAPVQLHSIGVRPVGEGPRGPQSGDQGPLICREIEVYAE
jgi:TPR repeat protein